MSTADVTIETPPELLPIATNATCCPLLRQPLTASQAADLSRVLKALADPARLRLVSMVAAHEDREACVCDLTGPLGLTQPTISHHLKILLDAGIFTRQKRGKWAFYALVPSALDALSAALSTVSPVRAALQQRKAACKAVIMLARATGTFVAHCVSAQ